MLSFSVPNILSIALAVFFLIGAAINGIAPKKIRQSYVRWGMPPWFPYITAVLELAVAVLLIWSGSARLAGALLGASVMLGAILTLVRSREAAHAIPAAVVGLCCVYLGVDQVL